MTLLERYSRSFSLSPFLLLCLSYIRVICRSHYNNKIADGEEETPSPPNVNGVLGRRGSPFGGRARVFQEWREGSCES